VDIRAFSQVLVTWCHQKLLSGCAERVHRAEETPWSTAIQVLRGAAQIIHPDRWRPPFSGR
jgi:hypothetical protein